MEHYELLTDENGQPVELGRGAMGIPQAQSTWIFIPVTLKSLGKSLWVSEATPGEISPRRRAGGECASIPT